jgi:hypothetical protein
MKKLFILILITNNISKQSSIYNNIIKNITKNIIDHSQFNISLKIYFSNLLNPKFVTINNKIIPTKNFYLKDGSLKNVKYDYMDIKNINYQNIRYSINKVFFNPIGFFYRTNLWNNKLWKLWIETHCFFNYGFQNQSFLTYSFFWKDFLFEFLLGGFYMSNHILYDKKDIESIHNTNFLKHNDSYFSRVPCKGGLIGMRIVPDVLQKVKFLNNKRLAISLYFNISLTGQWFFHVQLNLINKYSLQKKRIFQKKYL